MATSPSKSTAAQPTSPRANRERHKRYVRMLLENVSAVALKGWEGCGALLSGQCLGGQRRVVFELGFSRP
jgi:hypothetical protein